MTLPILPEGWFDLPPEQRRQWEQLQRQHANHEWRKATRLEHRSGARRRGLHRSFLVMVTPLLLVIVIAALTIGVGLGVI